MLLEKGKFPDLRELNHDSSVIEPSLVTILPVLYYHCQVKCCVEIMEFYMLGCMVVGNLLQFKIFMCTS